MKGDKYDFINYRNEPTLMRRAFERVEEKYGVKLGAPTYSTRSTAGGLVHIYTAEVIEDVVDG
tara:strand:+ start:215 stop:403 length:189 start_codon:yes stop_codon:yes gene_type:complete